VATAGVETSHCYIAGHLHSRLIKVGSFDAVPARCRKLAPVIRESDDAGFFALGIFGGRRIAKPDSRPSATVEKSRGLAQWSRRFGDDVVECCRPPPSSVICALALASFECRWHRRR